jgi:hypothetical protein
LREDRAQYAAELARVLRANGRLLLRACTTSEGKPNDVNEEEVERTFDGWRTVTMARKDIESDTHSMAALIVRLERS